ncbi:MAG TPA: LysM peptidoglycan-binding domain-containing protein [Anaerolineales bacterium]|nr:LysM peptidoglycan-binding domain-containing protein [Anaerolineales bacterium]
MNPNRLRLINLVTLSAALAACNMPTRAAREATLQAILATMDAVTPMPTGTLPPTETPGPGAVPTPVRVEQPFPNFEPSGATFFYTTRSGDTLPALAGRFGVEQHQMSADVALPSSGLLPPGQQVQIPNVLESISPGGDLLPDGELVYSPTASDFDLHGFVASAGGYLSRHSESLPDGSVLGGAAIVQRVADENSVNPRLLLALLEFRSGWVFGSFPNAASLQYPIGFRIPERTGLYQDLTVAAVQLNLGYYGWRAGTMLETKTGTGGTLRWNPTLNAGSVALLRLFVLLTESDEWLNPAAGFAATYEAMFGDAWARAEAAGPLLPPGLAQPPLELPFAPREYWSLTAGPHNAWSYGTPRAALDFSPITGGDPCDVSPAWATASAPGVIVRATDNAVALDLDGDGRESTGWVLLYYHLADEGLISPWIQVSTGDPLGHPSCQGGRATGKHVHLVRKYNGEWIPADGLVPFSLSGWQVVADARNYYGSLVRGDEVVMSDSSGQRGSTIWR